MRNIVVMINLDQQKHCVCKANISDKIYGFLTRKIHFVLVSRYENDKISWIIVKFVSARHLHIICTVVLYVCQKKNISISEKIDIGLKTKSIYSN